ncbi:MAG: cytochrome c [Chloroflexota bacterium]|nr:cytochrome c [Chloroflexota bacterium]
MKRILLCALALVTLVAASACGTVATPEWAAEAQGTRVAQVSTDTYLTAIAPTATPTLTPTATLTPTFTPLPPTETPIPTATPTPLPPTAAPTVEVAVASGADVAAAALAAGDSAAGMVVFQTQHALPDGSAWACMSCHSVDASGVRLIGPGLWNVSVRGETRVAGQNAAEYVRNSILHPADYIAPVADGEAAWALNMPLGWDTVLSEQELNDVIAYLFTLR